MNVTDQRFAPGVACILPGDEQYLRCLRCGLCVPSCPVYRESLLESDSPRGRIALVKAAVENGLALSSRYADRIYRCTLCAACEQVCPSGVEVEELLLAARTDLAEKGWLPPFVERLAGAVLTAHNISGEDNRRRLIWTENMERLPQGASRKQASLAYFVGCVSSFFPTSYSIPQALVRIMEAAGADYALLGGEEWCCGYPLLASGLRRRADELIAHNVAQVKALGADILVTSCPSCYHMWRVVYPTVAGELGVRVLHATEWLAEVLDQDRLPLQPLPVRATYHDPCDLGRKSGVYVPPRRVLQRIPGLELVEMADHHANALCCGGGGNLESYDAQLTTSLARNRLDQARAVGAEWLLTTCQQCKRTLTNANRQDKSRSRLRILDVVELIDRLLEK